MLEIGHHSPSHTGNINLELRALLHSSSTKSLSGHALGAAGVQEAIYGLIMMKENFIAGSANIENIDEGAESFPIVRENFPTKLERFLSNSFGFGGTNACLIFDGFNL